jgi:hypothetical protein
MSDGLMAAEHARLCCIYATKRQQALRALAPLVAETKPKESVEPVSKQQALDVRQERHTQVSKALMPEESAPKQRVVDTRKAHRTKMIGERTLEEHYVFHAQRITRDAPWHSFTADDLMALGLTHSTVWHYNQVYQALGQVRKRGSGQAVRYEWVGAAVTR